MSAACAASSSCINAYGANLTLQLHTNLLALHPTSGAFLDSCNRHCQTENPPLDDSSLQSPTQAFAAWYSGDGRRSFGQNASFPCTTCCGAQQTSDAQAIPYPNLV